MSLPEADKLFESFRNERDKVRSAVILDELFEKHVNPLIQPILIKGLQSGKYSHEKVLDDVRDLMGEIAAGFVKRFDKKNGNILPNIENIEAYFTTVANRSVSNFWRKRNPNWCSLRNKIFYLFDKRNKLSPKDFIYLKDKKLLNLNKFGEKKSHFSIGELDEIIKKDDLITPQTDLVQSVRVVLKQAKGGLIPNDLVNLFFDLQNVDAEMNETPLEDTIHSIANQTFGDNEQLRLEARIKLGKIWLEIAELPFSQRFALLLQMQEKGFSGVHLMVFLQVVKFKELAESLGMTVKELAELYNDLPLTDNQIATLLTAKLKRTNPNAEDVTPKQVGNLRKVARERLQRKLKLIDE